MRLDHLLSKEESRGCVSVGFSCKGKMCALLSCQWLKDLAAIRMGDTPVLIPNTTVKTCTADGTILETVWKSRRLPDLFNKVLANRFAV